MFGTDLELVATQVEETPTIVMPLTGALVDLREPVEVARALQDVRDLKRRIDELRALLEGVLTLEARRQGTKTLHLEGVDAVVTGGEKVEYDAELLQERLRAAGLPEDRVGQAVQVIVSYKVSAVVLRQLAAANPAYAKAITEARSTVETPWRVTIKTTKTL